MTTLQLLTALFILILLFELGRRGRRIKKLEVERPTLDLRSFMSIYRFEALMHDERDDEVIVNTCIRTAEDMDVKITVHQELDEEIKKEEKRLLGDIYDPLAAERLEKLRHLHHILP